LEAGVTGAATPAADSSAAGIIAEVRGALAAGQEALAATLELAALEAQRAGVAVIWMIICSFVAIIFVVAVWIALMVALGLWVVASGFSPTATIASIALINLGLAGVLLYAAIRMGHLLLFPATRRQLAGKVTAPPPHP
jgi:uncharacterized membrane protein YqjE